MNRITLFKYNNALSIRQVRVFIKYVVKLKLSVVISLLMFSCSESQDKHIVKESIVNEAVYASGELLPKKYNSIIANKTERVLDILVKEGDFVNANDILIILGSVEDESNINLIKEQIRIAKENISLESSIISELNNKIKYAKQKSDLDSLNAEKLKVLYKSKAVSKKEMEQSILESQNSLNQYFNLKNQLRTTKSKLLYEQLDIEKQLNKNQRLIRSGISGKVFSIEKKKGEIVYKDELIMMVGEPTDFIIELIVDERDIKKISLNQEVYFETDIYPNKQFNASITKINPVIQKQNRSFKVEAVITDSLLYEILYPLATVEANIIFRKQESILTIPLDFIISNDSVDLLMDDETKRVKIKKGSLFKDFIEITSGLRVNDVIVKPI